VTQTQTLTGIFKGPLLGFLVLMAASAQSQQPSQAQIGAIRQSCRSDYSANCAGVPTGGQAALACLQQHQAQLSPACREAVGAVGGGASGAAAGAGARTTPPPASRAAPGGAEIMREECGPDVQRVCRGVLPGRGRIIACLADNRESLSQGCRQALMSMRERQ
jgi:hypothetical protein